jgi:outer membrane biosynthesis protein TonB
MSFKDGEIQAVSILGTAILTSALTIPAIYLTKRADVVHERFENMESIEASIAYKKEPQKQPQKQTSQPVVKKDEGVSHDETKKPIEGCKADADCKPDEKCKNSKCVPREEPKQTKVASTDDVLQKFHHSDDDADPGKPTTQPGDFNGNEIGWAPVTQGDPFWQGFVKDIRNNFNLPTISETNGPPEGCFHITPDGKIADTKINKKSDSPDLELAAENALDAVKKLRNDSPVPVPTQLLGQISRWICFRFDPNKI